MIRFRSMAVFVRLVAVCAVAGLVAASCGGSTDDTAADESTATTDATESDEPEDDAPAEPAEEPAEETSDETTIADGELIGTFGIDPAECDGADISGSYFRMIQPGGDLTDGPFVPNADSPCTDATFSALVPGTTGGLVSGAYQPPPDPPFDDSGNGLSNAIVEPVTFFALFFSIATNEPGNVPTIVSTGGELSGDMSAWTAYYADLIFEQGAPAPDGSLPGLTSEVSGTIDPDTGAYSLEWSSQISGGSFNDFTGVWHLEGTFDPA